MQETRRAEGQGGAGEGLLRVGVGQERAFRFSSGQCGNSQLCGDQGHSSGIRCGGGFRKTGGSV